VALLAVVGPGMLAGLSDDDPAGITTYSILGADYGYRLLWVLAVSTAALIVFHELGARMGIVTGKGLLALVRERYGRRGAGVGLSALAVANLGTLCAEFAGVAAGMELLAGVSRYVSVPVAAVAVSLLVLRGSFHRVEHVLLALSAVFVGYIISGILARPDWGAAAKGLVVPSIPLTRDAVLVAVATLGTTLAPWGLAFIQSYAVDKRLTAADLRYERVDVIVGALLTGIIGFFIVVACAATLNVRGIEIGDARDARTRAGAARGPAGLDPLRGGVPGRRAARCVDRAAFDRLLGFRGVRDPLRCERRFRRGAPVLLELRSDGARSRDARAHPGSAAHPHPVPLPGAERDPSARAAAVHAEPWS